MKRLLGSKKLLVRLAWLLAGVVPAFLLHRSLGGLEALGERTVAQVLVQPLAVAVVWMAAGLWIFLQGKLKLIAKIWVSVGLMALLVWVIFSRSQSADVVERLATISVWWMAGAFLVQLVGMSGTVWRWKVLLEAQDLKVPLRHLIGTFLIGRFVGSFLPSTVGLDGYRMWDIARHSGQAARSVSVIVVEKIIGFFVLSTLVIATIPWGLRFIPAPALIATAVLFSVPVCLSFSMLMMPRLIRRVVSRVMPPDTKLGAKVNKAVRAVTAYERHRRALLKAVAIGFIVHLGTTLMYFFTAHAIGVNVGLGEILYVGPLMITATVVPLSVAGIGVREYVVSTLMSQVGHPEAAAVVFAFLGYLVGEVISLFGGLVLLARRSQYKVAITGAAMEGDSEEEEDLPEPEPIPAAERPRIADYALTGLGGGMVAGLLLGVSEAAVIVAAAHPPRDLTVLGWAAAVSGTVWALAGGGMGLFMGLAARLLGLRKAPAERRYAFIAATLLAGFGFVVTWFRVYRDVFHESVRPASPVGMMTLLGLAAAALVLFFAARFALRKVTTWRRARFLVKPWGTPAAVGATAALLVVVGLLGGEDHAHANGAARHVDAAAPNIVLVMVDTVRADHLSMYGAEEETSPNLAAFSQESVLFEHASAQASWTRPSVATILTGRYASSHSTMDKEDALPDEVETLAEVLQGRGYRTGGLVTNFNLAPYFNFQQGFETYEFLEPVRLLGADDSSSKLALYELLRRVAARLLPVRPEAFYREASYTTDQAIDWLRTNSPEQGPYFLFLTYMDPHDPYFPHPYDGTAIGHATTPSPDPAMADRIRELYDGEIHYWDEHFGRLLAALRQRPDWDRTIVVVCADHGEEFFEHGGWYHGTTLYEEQVAVPLIVRLPGGELGGTREGRRVGLVDIAPTLSRLAGAAVPEAMQGVDLFAGEGGDRALFAEENHQGNRLRSVRFSEAGRDWKLIEANEGNPRGLPPVELFDMARDPGEERSVAEVEEGPLDHARERLEVAAGEAAEGAVSAERRGLDGSAVEQLRNLGYMH